MKKQRKTIYPPNFLNVNSLFAKIYHVFHKLLSTIILTKEFYHFVYILSPFSNELIKYKLREVDTMHEIKNRVSHRSKFKTKWEGIHFQGLAFRVHITLTL
jgi:hypothetical protein